MSANVDATPPRLVARVRSELQALVSDSHATSAAVRHRFEPVDLERGGSVFGWETTLEPAGPGEAVQLWFDGHDDDLVLEVDSFGWVEWFALDAEDVGPKVTYSGYAHWHDDALAQVGAALALRDARSGDPQPAGGAAPPLTLRIYCSPIWT